jgi:peptidyl-prolyl cis-trans isomerase B (cyclophilin B)
MKRTMLLVALALAVVGSSSGCRDDPPAASAPAPSNTAVATASSSPMGHRCGWIRVPDRVGPPPVLPSQYAPDTGWAIIKLTTNRGLIEIRADRRRVPCTLLNIDNLATGGYYRGVACRALRKDSVGGALDCGDPDGTGPWYRMPAEDRQPFEDRIYSRGQVVLPIFEGQMVGGGFSFVYRDSHMAGVPILGEVTRGMDIIDRVAAAGAGKDHRPKRTLSIQSVQVIDAP